MVTFNPALPDEAHVALASLCTALANLGLITNSTS